MLVHARDILFGKIGHYGEQIACVALHTCWRCVILCVAVIQKRVLENRAFALFLFFPRSFSYVGRYRRVQHHGQFPDTPGTRAHADTPSVTHRRQGE